MHCPDNIRKLIDAGSVDTFFQPVVSIGSRTILGFEALSRGVLPDGSALDAGELFSDDLSPEVLNEIDRLCRHKALEKFQGIIRKHKDMLLFINIAPKITRAGSFDMDYLKNQVAEYGYNPGNIVIESSYAKMEDKVLFPILSHYREQGFLFCLDDFCLSYETLGLIPKFKPDFIKVPWRKDDVDQVLLRYLIMIAEREDSALIAGRIETEQEAQYALEQGIFLQQGFFYTKDSDGEAGSGAVDSFVEKTGRLNRKYGQWFTGRIRKKREVFAEFHGILKRSVSQLENALPDQFDTFCGKFIRNAEGMKTVFVLDTAGIQVTHTFTGMPASNKRIKKTQKGADHSICDYFLHLVAGCDVFVSPPFVSEIDKKNSCIFSRKFVSADGIDFFVCLEFPCE